MQDLNNVERATTTTAADINNAPMLVMNDKDHSGGGLTMFPVMNYPPLPLGQRNPQLAQSDVKHNWGCDLELASTKLLKGTSICSTPLVWHIVNRNFLEDHPYVLCSHAYVDKTRYRTIILTYIEVRVLMVYVLIERYI